MFFYHFPINYRLELFIKLNKLNQSEFSRIANIDRSVLSRYIKGTSKPKESTVEEFANNLHVNSDWILGKKADIQDISEKKLLENNNGIFRPVARFKVDKNKIDYSNIELLTKLIATELRTNSKLEKIYFNIFKKVGDLNEVGLLKLLYFIDSELESNEFKLKNEDLNLLYSNEIEDYSDFICLEDISKNYK